MTAIASLRAVAWLVRDTFRQALASGSSWLMLAGSAACVALCLAAPLDGPAGAYALEQQLAGWAVHVVGLLLALVVTAGNATQLSSTRTGPPVLLAKPVSRRALLAGKVLGVLAFVAFHAALFVGGAWLALAVPRRRLGPGVPALRPAVGLALRGLFQLFRDAGRGDAEHCGVRLRDGAVLAAVLGDEFRPARGDGNAGPACHFAGLRLDHRLRLTGYCPSRSTSNWRCRTGRTARSWGWAAWHGRRRCRCWRRRCAAWGCWRWRRMISPGPSIDRRRPSRKRKRRFSSPTVAYASGSVFSAHCARQRSQ